MAKTKFSKTQIATVAALVSPNLKQAIQDVWQEIGNELEGVSDNEEALETCLDADRLLLSANNKEANEELKKLDAEHGYMLVLKAISSIIHLV